MLVTLAPVVIMVALGLENIKSLEVRLGAHKQRGLSKRKEEMASEVSRPRVLVVHLSVVQRVDKHLSAPEAVASAATIRQEQVPLPSVVVQQALDRSLVPQVSGAEA